MAKDKVNHKFFTRIILFLSILISCNPKETQLKQNFLGPMLVEAKGEAVPRDSMAEPTITHIDESKLKIKPVGTPKVLRTNTNIFPAGKPMLVIAGTPPVFTPGQDTFSLPQSVPTIDRPFLAGFPEAVIAKDPAVKDQNPQNFSSFNKLQGLKAANIRCMLQDKIGNIWLGTNGGVSKFDGKAFTHFTEKEGLCNNFVLSILNDSRGNLWFGTNGGGVSKYDGKFFTTFSKNEWLNNNVVTSILEDHTGNIWFGTYGGGVSKYDGKTFTPFTQKQGLNNDLIWSILEDKKGNIWFGTDGDGVSKYDGTSFFHFTEKEGLSENVVGCMLEDRDGNIWFGTNGGVSKYDGVSFTHFTEKEGLSNNNVTCMLQDINGNLWFGTYGGGISMYDGKSFIQYTEKEGLNTNNVLSMLQDKSGNIWSGTQGGGVSKFGGISFTTFSEAEGLSKNEVRSIMQDHNGNLWFGTSGGGASKYDGKSFTTFTYKDGLSDNDNDVLSMLADKKGNLWFGTTGVSKYNGKSFTFFDSSLGSTTCSVLSILEDKKGNIWFGTYGEGVSMYNNGTFSHFKEEQGLSNNYVYCMLEDNNGSLWFGTQGGGVSRYDGNYFIHFTKENGLSNDVVLSMIQDQHGNIWFGTWGGGVCEYDGKYFTHFTEKEGLCNNFVYSILQDKHGNLWFGTRFGLSKLSAAKLMTITDKIKTHTLEEKDIIFKNYVYDDGFLGIGCNGNAICEANDGTIWIGTNDKLTAFHPEGEIPDTIAPNIQLTGLSIFNETIDWSILENKKDSTLILGNGVQVSHFSFEGVSNWYGLPQNLSLAYNNNFLTFNFAGITMSHPKKVKYQYTLEGLDDTWSALTTRTEAPYGNLPPATYTFKVKAMNSEGYWSNTFVYPFTIRPPWWATWWAYSLYAILATSIGYALYRNRINQLESKQSAQIKTMVATQEEERKRISRDLHDDIGTKLSALKLFLSSLSEKAAETQNEEIISLTKSSAQFITDALQDVRQLLLNLSPTVLEEFGYTTAVEGMVNKINETKQIHFNLVVFGMKERLHKDYELALYRITQELINNILKHAQAKHVSVQIGIRDDKIILMIEDDGLGFDVNARKDGFGLANLNARTKLMHGIMTLDSHPGKGTTVLIEIPYYVHRK